MHWAASHRRFHRQFNKLNLKGEYMAKLKATDEQIQQMMANAVNASIPMGLGHLHATNRVFQPSDFPLEDGRGLYGDYVQGRMVKVGFAKVNGVWEVRGCREPRGDYQSWASQYPTIEALAKSAGAEILPE